MTVVFMYRYCSLQASIHRAISSRVCYVCECALQIVSFVGGAILLASGGAGHVYPNTTNPTVCVTASGILTCFQCKRTILSMLA